MLRGYVAWASDGLTQIISSIGAKDFEVAARRECFGILSDMNAASAVDSISIGCGFEYAQFIRVSTPSIPIWGVISILHEKDPQCRWEPHSRQALNIISLAIGSFVERDHILNHISRLQRFATVEEFTSSIDVTMSDMLHNILSEINLARNTMSLAPIDQRNKAFDSMADYVSRSKKQLEVVLGTISEVKTSSDLIVAGDILSSSIITSPRSDISIIKNIEKDIWPIRGVETNVIGAVQRMLNAGIKNIPSIGTIYINAENILIKDNISLPDGAFVRISVIDSGPMSHRINETCGISDDLGLLYAQRLVQMCGGSIVCEPNRSCGLGLAAYLPAAPADSGQMQSEYFNFGKILLVDDEGVARKDYHNLMLAMGYEEPNIYTAGSGEEAIEIVRDEGPDAFSIILMDVQMPGGIPGDEAARVISTLSPQSRIVLATGIRSRDIDSLSQSCGAAAYLVKPFTLKDILRVFKQIVPNDDHLDELYTRFGS
jgi:CheY-like chemotaxis protein